MRVKLLITYSQKGLAIANPSVCGTDHLQVSGKKIPVFGSKFLIVRKNTQKKSGKVF